MESLKPDGAMTTTLQEMSPTELVAHRLQCIERCLTANVGTSTAREFNSYLLWMFKNGGPNNLAGWCFKKLINREKDLDEIKLWRIEVFLRRYKTWASADAVVQVIELERQDAINAAKRADNMNALQKRAIAEREQREHPHLAIRRRLEESLRLNAGPKEKEGAPPPKGHCRKAKGECGTRIGERLDSILWLITHHEDEADWPDDELFEIDEEPDEEPLGLDDLLLEIQTEPEPSDQVSVGVAHSQIVSPVVITSSVDPPHASPGGVREGTDEPAAEVGGDNSGFITDHGTAWDAFSGQPDCVNDISGFLTEIDENPRLRSSANLRTLSRVRDEIEKLPESASLGDPVVLRLQDVLMLMSQITSRLR